MLERLQTISEEAQDTDPELFHPKVDEDEICWPQEAVVFESSTTIKDILKEAQSIRKDTTLLRLEVERFNGHNERYGTSMRRLTLLKKHSDHIARGIQERSGDLYSRLQDLREVGQRIEAKEGPNAAVSRIARAQYETLTHDLNEVMSEYNEAEEMQRKTCRKRIQRQASILGSQITDKELDEMVDKGGEGWADLSGGLQNQGGWTSRWALCEIKGRHRELVELEARMKEIHELFVDMARLVEEQGCMLNNIEANVSKTEEYVVMVNDGLARALRYKRKNPFLQCCGCLPCWSYNRS